MLLLSSCCQLFQSSIDGAIYIFCNYKIYFYCQYFQTAFSYGQPHKSIRFVVVVNYFNFLSKKLVLKLSSDYQAFVKQSSKRSQSVIRHLSSTLWCRITVLHAYSKASFYAIIVSQKNIAQNEVAQIEVSIIQ